MQKHFLNNFKQLVNDNTPAYCCMPIVVGIAASRIMTTNIFYDIFVILLLVLVYIFTITFLLLIHKYLVNNKWQKQKRKAKRRLYILSDIEKDLVKKHFHMQGVNKMTYNSLASKYGISREKLRSIERKAVAKVLSN